MNSWSLAEIGLVVGYLGTLVLLCVYGLHRLELVWRLRRPARRTQPSLHPTDDAHLPRVTVQLPIRNERYVVERLLRSVAALQYPRDRFEIQVLDDSDDDTSDLVARLCRELEGNGIATQHLRRREREGYKAGALEAGLRCARGEFTFILDADFVVPRDFLRRAIMHFQDPSVGMVQARWGHLNGEATTLTRAQSLMLDGHFAVQHRARFRAGRYFNFNGTAGLFRNAAIVAAGGWQYDTLTEDLDLSYRMQMAGYRGVYLHDLVVPGELPTAIGALKSQQHRWTKGSLQTCRKLLLPIWKSAEPMSTKIEATFHLTDNVAYLLLLLLSLLSLPALVIRHVHGAAHLWILDVAVLMAGVGALFVFYGDAARATDGRLRIARVPLLMALGIGLAVNNSLAVVGGLLRIPSGFVRTPKTGGATLRLDGGYRPRRDLLFLLELGMAFWVGLALTYAVAHDIPMAVPFLALLTAGHLWVGTASARGYLLSRAAGTPRGEPQPAQP